MDQDKQNVSSSSASDKVIKDKLFGDKEGKLANGLSYEEFMEKDVLELMGFTTLSDEKKKEMYQMINEMVENRTAVQVYDRLTEAEREEYDKLLQENDDKKAYEYLEKKNININEILLTETVMLKLELYEDSLVVRDRTKKMLEEEEKKRKAKNG